MTADLHPVQEAQALLSDVRMEGVGFSIGAPSPPFSVAGLHGPVSLCYQVRGGAMWLEVETSSHGQFPNLDCRSFSDTLHRWVNFDDRASSQPDEYRRVRI